MEIDKFVGLDDITTSGMVVEGTRYLGDNQRPKSSMPRTSSNFSQRSARSGQSNIGTSKRGFRNSNKTCKLEMNVVGHRAGKFRDQVETEEGDKTIKSCTADSEIRVNLDIPVTSPLRTSAIVADSSLLKVDDTIVSKY